MTKNIAWIKEHPLEAVFFGALLEALLIPVGSIINVWQVVLAGMVGYVIVAGIAAWAYLPDKSLWFKILGCVMLGVIGFAIYMAVELVGIVR